MIIQLNEPIECQRLCNLIQRLIVKHQNKTQSPANALSIKVVDISDSTAHIPKLEHKNV